jgi:hypothetical protein
MESHGISWNVLECFFNYPINKNTMSLTRTTRRGDVIIGQGADDNQVDPALIAKVKEAPDMLPKEGLLDYSKRTGIKDAGVIFHKLKERADRWFNSPEYKALCAKAEKDAKDFEESNKDTPENNERRKAVVHAFIGAIGNEMGYRVANQAWSWVKTINEPMSKALGAVDLNTGWDIGYKICDFIYNNILDIPDDLSTKAAVARIAQDVYNAQKKYGGSLRKQRGGMMVTDDDLHLLDLMMQYPDSKYNKELPSEYIARSNWNRNDKLDTANLYYGRPRVPFDKDPYGGLTKGIVNKLDQEYNQRLSDPEVQKIGKGDRGQFTYLMNKYNESHPYPIPSQQIPQWLKQGVGLKHLPLVNTIMKTK